LGCSLKSGKLPNSVTFASIGENSSSHIKQRAIAHVLSKIQAAIAGRTP